VGSVIICDVCGKPTERVALKLFKAPTDDSGVKGHNDYTSSCDVGPCCVLKINQISWHPRKKREKKEAA
jgi:hypothetical protein